MDQWGPVEYQKHMLPSWDMVQRGFTFYLPHLKSVLQLTQLQLQVGLL